MIDILQLTNQYARKKIEQKHPCVKEDPQLIEELYKAFVSAARDKKKTYHLLRDNIYECIHLINLWQSELDIPDFKPKIAKIYAADFRLKENYKTIGGCSHAVVKSIYEDLVNLWIAFIAVYEENNELDHIGHVELIKDLKKQMKEEMTLSEGLPRSRSFTGPIIVLILLVLIGAGFWFFRSGQYLSISNPFGASPIKISEKTQENPTFGKGDSVYIVHENDTLGMPSSSYEVYEKLLHGGQVKVPQDSLFNMQFLDMVNRIDRSKYVEIRADEAFLERLEKINMESYYLHKKDNNLRDSAVISITKI